MTFPKDSFCPVPWMTFYLEPNGRVDMCCIGKADLGSVHTQSIKDIIKSPGLIEIKKQMLDNQPVQACRACHEGYGLQQRFVREFGGREHPDYQTAESFKLKYLDLRWNNTCNYACIYCGPELSSLWAQIKDVKQIKLSSVRQDMLDLARDNIDTLEEIYLAGGEPLMLKDNLTILSQLHERNPGCRILINTNLSQIHDNEIFDLLCRFEHVQWHISAEAVGQQYEYIRWPGKWEVFDQNLRTLRSLDRTRHDIAFNLVWLNLNGLGIWDYVDHLANIDLDISKVSILPYNMDVWDGPWHLKHMPRDYLQKIREKMEEPKYKEIYTYQQNIEFLHKYIDDPDHRGQMQDVIYQLKHLDNSRNLDSLSTFPIIYSYQ